MKKLKELHEQEKHYEYYQGLERETKGEYKVKKGCLCCKKNVVVRSGTFETKCRSVEIYLSGEIKRLANKNMGVTFFSFETKNAKDKFVKYFEDNV